MAIAIARPHAAATLLAPADRMSRVLYEIGLVLAGTALIALSAQAAILLPFSPVPVTGQTFAILLVGMLYGGVRGGATVVAYLAEGAAGLPVFASAGAGPAVLFGHTGGYLFAFIAAAALVGFLGERGWDRRFISTLIAMTLGTAVIFIGGSIVLAAFVGPQNVLALGVVPFLPGAVVKIVAAACVLPIGWKILGRTPG